MLSGSLPLRSGLTQMIGCQIQNGFLGRYVFLRHYFPTHTAMVHSAYFHSTTTLNYVRALLTSGFASLRHPRHWSLSHVRSPALRSVFIEQSIHWALDFMRIIGKNLKQLQKVFLMPLISVAPLVSTLVETVRLSKGVVGVVQLVKSISTQGNILTSFLCLIVLTCSVQSWRSPLRLRRSTYSWISRIFVDTFKENCIL